MRQICSRHVFPAILFLFLIILHSVFFSINFFLIGILACFFGMFFILDRILSAKNLGSYFFLSLGFIVGVVSGRIFFDIMKLSGFPLPVFSDFYFLLFSGYFGAFTGFNMDFSAMKLNPKQVEQDESKSLECKLLDTSVIIDGRINDIIETGFLRGTVIVTKFVLNEIQALADSKDSIKRSRARRGLDVLNHLKEQNKVHLMLTSEDYPDIKGVDSKLVALAKEKKYTIFTNDYNLNKIAQIEGVFVLNINDLINALKPVLIPGEELELEVLREGKEPGQGLGYLPDGTMVVVAQGANLVGKKLNVRVTSTLQTSAGRIIFADGSQ